MAKFTRHIFVCCNQRPEGHPRGCCSSDGSARMQELFKKKLAEHGIRGSVRANKAGCLDQCEHGPTVVVYPESIWYGGVTESDVDAIVQEHIRDGHPVERLMLAESCINTTTCEHKPRKNC